jgi:hypothetical protein
MESWRGTAICTAAFMCVAAAFHFLGVASSATLAQRALGALVFSGLTFGAGLTLGLLVWTGAWLGGGRQTALDMRDTVLWVAALFGIICLGFAVLS